MHLDAVGLMVSALNYGSSDAGSSPDRDHCVLFLGETLYHHSASLHPGGEVGGVILPRQCGHVCSSATYYSLH